MTGLVAAIVQYGYPVVVLAVALESLGLPLPGEALMIALGASAATDHLNIAVIFLSVWAGSVIGDNIGFLIGRRYGGKAVSVLGRRAGLTEARFAAIEASFRRYGVFVVVFARFFVLLRQLNGVMSGSLGLPWWRFLLANVVGAALWAGFWLYASSRLSAGFISAIEGAHRIKVVLFSMLIAGGLAMIAIWLLRRRRTNR
jgi:membrane protein DedA with SNARE-associated domain